jgi:uncharacterized protein YgbK (DUF1537 family)
MTTVDYAPYANAINTKANRHSWNYKAIDDTLIANPNMSAAKVANMLNEYVHRVVYRQQKLMSLGLYRQERQEAKVKAKLAKLTVQRMVAIQQADKLTNDMIGLMDQLAEIKSK